MAEFLCNFTERDMRDAECLERPFFRYLDSFAAAVAKQRAIGGLS